VPNRLSGGEVGPDDARDFEEANPRSPRCGRVSENGGLISLSEVDTYGSVRKQTVTLGPPEHSDEVREKRRVVVRL